MLSKAPNSNRRQYLLKAAQQHLSHYEAFLRVEKVSPTLEVFKICVDLFGTHNRGGTWLSDEHSSAGLVLDPTVLEVFSNLYDSMIF